MLTILGIIGVVGSLFAWGHTNFGELDPERTLRMLIPALAAGTIGMQTILFSLFLSVLGMGVRTRPKARL